MYGLRSRNILALVLMVLVAICAIGSKETPVLASPSWEGVPSLGPIPFVKGGFTTQPQSDYYLTKGNNFEIDTKFYETGLAKVNLGLMDKYVWYESNNNNDWYTISGNGPILTENADKIGDTRYQVEHIFYKIIPFTKIEYQTGYFFSNVATVHVSDTFKYATSAKVITDSDYLLNASNPYFTGTTFAHTQLIPSDSTAQTTWSSSNTSLAKVNATTGEITANSNGESGTVDIIGTIDNKDKKNLREIKSIEVGGGLKDQYAKCEDNVTFKLLSVGNSTRDDSVLVDWYRSANGGPFVKIDRLPKDNKYEYTIKDVEKENVGDKYHAVIKIKNPAYPINSQKEYLTYQTNDANLHVTVPYDPNVTVDTHFVMDNNINDISVNDVKNGNKIEYKVSLKNEGYQNFTDSYYSLDLPKGSKIDSVTTIEGVPIDNNKYMISTDDAKEEDIFRLKLDDFKIKEARDFLIHIKINHDSSAANCVTTPYFYGLVTGGREYQSDEAKTLTINFAKNDLDGLILHIKNI